MREWYLAASGLLAALFALVDMWRVGDRFWPSGRWWSAALIGVDVLLATTMTYGFPTVLPPSVQSDFENSILLPVISAAVAGRMLYIVPVHAARTAAKRIMTLRSFILQEVEVRARSALVLYLTGTVYPAGDDLGIVTLKELARLVVQDWERRNTSQTIDNNTRILLNSNTIFGDTDQLMGALIKYGGLSACSMVVNIARAKAPASAETLKTNPTTHKLRVKQQAALTEQEG